MKPTCTVVVSVGLLILNAVVAGNAFATPVVACQVQHNLLQADLRAAQPSFKNQTDFERSQKILTDAWMDLTGGFQDPVAVQKMTNFQMSLNADPAVAQRLAAQAQNVIDCVNSLPPP
jgi:hypothetical protein